MESETVKLKSNWNFRVLLITLLTAFIIQTVMLDCVGSTKRDLAWILDFLILIRIGFAWLIKERNMGWKFYAILPFAFIFILELAELASWLLDN